MDAQKQSLKKPKKPVLLWQMREQPSHTAKTRTMVPHIKEFEYIVTDSEMEALILECTLIKKHSPHYNIMLKDDKTYPYIKVTVQEDFPRIFATRRREKDKAKYYGPFTDVLNVLVWITILVNVWHHAVEMWPKRNMALM